MSADYTERVHFCLYLKRLYCARAFLSIPEDRFKFEEDNLFSTCTFYFVNILYQWAAIILYIGEWMQIWAA